MYYKRILSISILTIGLLISPVFACLWDHDTLKMERQKFPTVIELITGKFLRHSKAFYEWRIKDRISKISIYPNKLHYYDDLAVAYDKIGQAQKAIETILKKDKIKPGLYETKANLGTFYIHSGQLKKGLKFIEEAIRINPDAHFGREIYQKHLVNYLLSKQIEGKIKLPLSKAIDRAYGESQESLDFGNYINEQHKIDGVGNQATAIKGILGMMRFGNYRSPILLEALGDLLLIGGNDLDAKRLAARAYLKASYEVNDEDTEEDYHNKVQVFIGVIEEETPERKRLSLEKLDEDFQKEIAEANEWFSKIKSDEQRWAQEGKNLDTEFTKRYYESPNLSSRLPFTSQIYYWLGFFAITLFLTIIIGVKIRKKQKAIN